jgi:outer membrane protein OmpA-like peptidoglycan-associated protein
LNQVANVLKNHPELLKLEVEGHTDDRGPAAMNTRLSLARARAVVQALMRRGVSPTRLVAKGAGPSRPVADNRTSQGRERNRRVEFRVVERKPTGLTTPVLP